MENPVIRKLVSLPGGKQVMMFSVLEDRYHIWRDLQGFHRWSLSQWPDDGIGGISTHGKSMTLQGAVEACMENEILWKEIS